MHLGISLTPKDWHYIEQGAHKLRPSYLL